MKLYFRRQWTHHYLNGILLLPLFLNLKNIADCTIRERMIYFINTLQHCLQIKDVSEKQIRHTCSYYRGTNMVY